MNQHKIGTDEWVASYEARRQAQTGLAARLGTWSSRAPLWGWLALILVAGGLLPVITNNNYIIRVGGTIALLGTLAMGLNIVVGYAGMLDLGFVAFYGIGGYAYAYLSSDFSAVHWPTWASLPLIAVLTALFGLLLGSPSLRLVGDYLAIVTLGFGQIFVQLTTSMTRVNLPGLEHPLDLTGGPNGIVELDPIRLFGFTARSVVDYYYVLLAVLLIVVVFVYRLNNSRIGRAWRALREDELAAEAMGMPTRRLKLQAFAIGAAIAGLSGALFAAWQGAVFPGNFDITLLITLYAIIVLGGLGSLPGVLLGAAVMIAAPEVLRNPQLAGVFFYAAILITLYATLRPRWHILLLLALVAVFGIVARLALVTLNPEAFVAAAASGSPLTDAIRSWLALPVEARATGNLAFGAVLLLIAVASRLKGAILRLVILIPTLYLLVFVWETRLSQEPSVTRLLFVGILLVALMIYRPNGLLGQRRVEIV